MNRVTLNRKQCHQLREIVERFIDTENFTIEQSSPSGIGPTTEIRFDLFEKSDTKIDVTDVSTW
jgi:hypothetical protein